MSERMTSDVADAADAFASFYHQQYRSIRAMTWALTGDLGAAEDVTQEAFLRAHQRWDDLRLRRARRLGAPGRHQPGHVGAAPPDP